MFSSLLLLIISELSLLIVYLSISNVFGFTPTIKNVNAWYNGFEILVTTGDNRDILSVFAENARYCNPNCVIGEDAIVEEYLDGFVELGLEKLEFVYEEVTLDNNVFLVSFKAFIQKGDCEAVVRATDTIYYNDDGKVIESYSINKPNVDVFLGVVGEVAFNSDRCDILDEFNPDKQNTKDKKDKNCDDDNESSSDSDDESNGY